MKKTIVSMAAVLAAVLLVLSAGCVGPSAGSTSSPGAPAATPGILPGTTGLPAGGTAAMPVTTGTANPEGARTGDTVAVYYTGALTNGTVFDSNMNATAPVEFILGNSTVIQGLNEAIEGMAVNEQKTVTIPPEKAYGAYNTSLIRTVNRTGPLANTTFAIGRYYTIHDKTTTGVSIVKILDITPTTITWDANDPLAGMDVVFTIRLVKIIRA